MIATASTSSYASVDGEPVQKSSAKRKRRLGKDGAKLSRNGRRILALRKMLSEPSAEQLNSAQEVLDFGRASNALFQDGLALSLAQHLVFMSTGHTPVPSSPHLCDIGMLHTPFLRTGWRLKELDPRREVVLASLMAIGARRSNHSSITGACDESIYLGADLNPSISLKDLSSFGLGKRREATCRLLAQRMMDLAENCGLLNDYSPEGKVAAAALQLGLFVVDPKHPYLADLMTNLHKRFSSDRKQSCSWSEGLSSLTPLEFDLYTALLRRKPPRIPEDDLFRVYGWHQSEVPRALEKLEAGLTRHNGSFVKISLLRELSRLQQRPPCDLADVPELVLSLQHIFSCLGVMEKVIGGLDDETFETPIVAAPHLAAIPMFAYSVLAFEVHRLCQDLAKTEPLAQDLIQLTRIRFLKWLKTFVRQIHDPQFTSQASSRHSRALLLIFVDTFPSWLEVCVEAIRQNDAEEGPYASVGFSWRDLESLQLPLVHAATIFAEVDQHQSNLAEALEALTLSSSTPTTEFQFPSETLNTVFHREGKQRVAEAMVWSALQVIANEGT